MPKQSNNNIEGSIEINVQKNTIEFSTPKIIIDTVIAVQAMILTITPLSKTSLLSSYNENSTIEKISCTDIYTYPTVELTYENGRVVNNNADVSNNLIDRKEESLEKSTADIEFRQAIVDLRRENAALKIKLYKSLPIHTLFYLIINSVIGACAATLLFVRFVLNIFIIDPYYLICALIISSGLFSTALVSLKDWKENLLNENE